jgi:serine/threonine-protein kinase HipA
MVKDQKEISVYADWHFFDSPQLVGKLYASSLRGKSVFAFEYDSDWIEKGFQIDPDLPLYAGLHHASSNEIFGIFKDSSPDRWGQLLMKRRAILLSKFEGKTSFSLSALDFLMGVHDSHRVGGLRFKAHPDGPFLNNDHQLAAPPWASLRELENAVQQYENNVDAMDEVSLKWMNQLIAPGGSLGGARPKADVMDADGKQWIAKFPSNRDDSDVGLWEMVVHELAVQAKLMVPKAFVKRFASPYHTYLTQRFDRTSENKRIHFASAMTLLQRKDGDDADSGVSYLDLVGLIKSECTNVTTNLEELYRRVLFSVCVSNTDDHLRNHGFLFTESGWTLSPAFDLNANETGTGLKLNIDEVDNALDLEIVQKTASFYLLSEKRADEIKSEVTKAVSTWRNIAKKYKIPLLEMEQKASAFRY